METHRIHLLQLLSLCDGEEIWSIAYCRAQGVPDRWVKDLRDAYESGFLDRSQTIVYQGRPINHFEGVLAVDLAVRIAGALGVEVRSILERYRDRSTIVRAIQEQVEEG
jgi:hypothetical protein